MLISRCGLDVMLFNTTYFLPSPESSPENFLVSGAGLVLAAPHDHIDDLPSSGHTIVSPDDVIGSRAAAKEHSLVLQGHQNLEKKINLI